MTKHKTGTREQWLAARLELLKAEKDLTRRSDELARRRQELPWVRIDKQYKFETDEGSASLADLFRGRSQLLIYHFMFGPDYKAGCPSCSAIADGFDGSVVHLANHDVTLAAVSRAPLAKLQAYKRRMGWSVPWASSPTPIPPMRAAWTACGACTSGSTARPRGATRPASGGAATTSTPRNERHADVRSVGRRRVVPWHVGRDDGGDDAAIPGPDAAALPPGRSRSADRARGRGVLRRLDCVRNGRLSAERSAGARHTDRGRGGRPA